MPRDPAWIAGLTFWLWLFRQQFRCRLGDAKGFGYCLCSKVTTDDPKTNRQNHTGRRKPDRMSPTWLLANKIYLEATQN